MQEGITKLPFQPLNLVLTPEQIEENNLYQEQWREKFTFDSMSAENSHYRARLAELEKTLELMRKLEVLDKDRERRLQTEIADCKRILGIK